MYDFRYYHANCDENEHLTALKTSICCLLTWGFILVNNRI